MLKRAYSTFEVKAVDDDAGIIEGIASTPTTDRMGDIVEPKGAQFKLPYIHIVVNNQVGFTTNYEDSRSTRYATDLAKMLGTPIFHVNGDDPEACVWAAKLAVDYREAYHRDVVIDLVCHGKKATPAPKPASPTSATDQGSPAAPPLPRKPSARP